MINRILFLLLLCVAGSTYAIAQTDHPALYARIVYIKPKEGKQKDFEEGYKRHLGWHKEHKDPWTWHGWTVISGERNNEFMDGTFFRTLQEFDHPVDPAGDSKHNKEHVSPYADFRTVETLRFLPAASRLSRDSLHAKFLKLYEVSLVPGKTKQFLAAMTEILTKGSFTCFTFEVIDGHTAPAYYLLVPYANYEALKDIGDLFYSNPATDLSTIVRKIQIQTLLYRPDLSLPGAKK